MSTALRRPDMFDVVEQELGPMTMLEARDIAWEFTGYPHFWNIPEDGATPEECFRKQLRELGAAHQEEET